MEQHKRLVTDTLRDRQAAKKHPQIAIEHTDGGMTVRCPRTKRDTPCKLCFDCWFFVGKKAEKAIECAFNPKPTTPAKKTK